MSNEKKNLELLKYIKQDELKKMTNEEQLKAKYNLQDNVILRIISLRECIKTKRQKSMRYEELILFLQSVMNYDDMQIWIMKQQMISRELTLNDMLEKFFELKTDDDILMLYDAEQNYNYNNINNIKNILNDDLEEDSDLHLGLIEEDDDDMKCYNKPKTLTRKIILSKDDIED